MSSDTESARYGDTPRKRARPVKKGKGTSHPVTSRVGKRPRKLGSSAKVDGVAVSAGADAAQRHRDPSLETAMLARRVKVPPIAVDEARNIFASVPDPWTLNALHVDAEHGMEECIRRQRKLVRRLSSYAPVLDRCAVLLQSELDGVDDMLHGRKHALRESLRRVKEARDHIALKLHEKKFEDTVKKYVVAHAARVEEEDLLRGAAKRRHILPTIGAGYALLDSDCSRETRPPVTVEEKLARLSKSSNFASRIRNQQVHGDPMAPTSSAPAEEDAAANARHDKNARAPATYADVRRGITTIVPLAHGIAAHGKEGCVQDAMSSAGLNMGASITNELSTGVVTEMLVALGAKRPAVDVVLPDHCPLCRVPMVKGIGEQVLVCPTCHLTKTFLDSTAASMAFGEDSVEFNMFQYRRINHFNDALNELQGKEKANITQAQLQRIMEQMYESFGAAAKEKITYAMVRHVIRDKLRMVKCYKHVVLVTSLLSGKPPVQMSPRHETLARLIFELMQEPFERAPFRERHNFLSYPVTLFKICQMLGLVEFFPMLPLLRGEDKLKQQEELFQWICSYRGWKAPPSVLSSVCEQLPSLA